MVDTKQFNPLPLLSVKEGLDNSLTQISANLERYFTEGWGGKEHLVLAHDELHRAVGVLQMLSLEGLAVFSRELETVLQEMLAQQQEPTAIYRDTLRGAILALTHYLNALVDGASNTALRLFYSYQELHQLRGLESAFEVDLFFPEFGVELPAEILAVPLVASAAASVKKARAQYQRALLRWLRQDNPAASLRAMREAVQTVMACAPQDQQRAFWWIATGLLDSLIHDGLPAELNANKLLARIDLQMKSMVENTQRDSEYNTTCGMQYMLARSHPVSETVDKIKQTYVLDTYLPEEEAHSYAETEQVLEQMRLLKNDAQELLEQCVKGDAESNKRFTEKLGEIYALSETLDRDTLQFLCKQIYHAVSETDNTDLVHQIKMEMAMAMLLLDNGIDRYQSLNNQFHEQVRMTLQIMQTTIAAEQVDENILQSLTALHCQVEEHEIMPPLANEMRNNLQQVELGLNLFFSDENKRDELASLKRLLSQVNGGLYMLALEKATVLVGLVQHAIERYVAGANPSPNEMQSIASAISTLESYAQRLSQGQKPDTANLEEAIVSINETAEQASPTAVAEEVIIPTGVAVREGGEDAELLEVFLEEANEVLETLHAQLQICQSNPNSREAMITIRRGFHTLKGSGRMVGLTNLGEVAWSIERALNKWLQDDKPTSISVLELIGDAEVLFQHWVDKLHSGGTALIDAAALVAAAQRIENGEVQAHEAQIEAQIVDAELADIVIGGVTLSPVLFKIATDEASGIIVTLQNLIAELRKNEHPIISYDFVRAAHTLSGISRSTGFTDISDLASALESWLQDHMDSTATTDSLQLNLLEQTINALTEMVDALRDKQEPKARHDLIARLQIKKKELTSKPAIVIPEEKEEVEGLKFSEELNLSDAPVQPEIPVFEQESISPVELSFESEEVHSDSNSPSEVISAESNEPEIQVEDDEMDLVAYVQRVAQEQANEPLQWQTPDKLSKTDSDYSAPKSTATLSVENNATTTPAIDNNAFSIDLSDLVLHQDAKNKPEVSIEKNTGSEAFSINFDELSLSVDASKEIENNSIQIDTKKNSKLEHDFLSSIALPIEEVEINESQPSALLEDESDELALQHNQQTQDEVKSSENFSIKFDELSISTEPVVVFANKATHEIDLKQDEPESDFLSSLATQADGIENIKSLPVEVQEEKQVEPIPQQKPQAQKISHDELSDGDADPNKRAILDDLDEQLLPIFMEEADELYPQLLSELGEWRQHTENPVEGLKIARKLQRSLHTLKGSARMAGAMRLGELTHRVEDCFDAAVAAGKNDSALLDELENFFDRIGNSLEKLRSGDTSADVPEPVVSVVTNKTSVAPVQSKRMQSVDQATDVVAEERRESALLRVRSDVVDNLVNEAGEISVARSRMEVELNAFKGGLMDLTGSVQGLRKLVREIEMHAEGQMQARAAVAGDSAEKFDPLEFDRFTRFQELTRFMNESVHDVQTVQQTLLKNLDETSAAMSAQAKLNSLLQQSLMSIRMLTFSSISQRLYRIVRQTGKELGKKVNLELYGTEIELDRGVLEKMTAPFEHLLRNAIVHGLENPDQRDVKGKSPIGNIALTLRQEGNEVVFEFKDDGAGLDTARLRQKGIEQGLIAQGEVVSDEKAMLLIFETGLSTAAELTEISGRGVGMDVVRSEIKALGGRIEVSSEIDKGACFTIYLPLTLAVMKALIVRAGTDTYAIPAVMVEQVQQVKPEDLLEMYRQGQVDWQNKSYPVHYLPRLLGDIERTPESKPYNAVILLRSGEQRMALHLDELVGNKEVVVKNVGIQLARLPGIAGATVQANGDVVLILNPIPLAEREIQSFKNNSSELPIVNTVRRIPVVMVVDDSLTVRKITTRLLTREGYEVITAKDGVDALEKLVDFLPDVMLLDVEMPRMDGFELTKQLRRDSKTKDLPIIMITSRTAEKHRNYAFELGVNEYLGKPYQENELMENIAKFAPLSDTLTTV
jgi:chemosensory pili system protein ChpA (sensor histidine kinase/response regulator)